VVIRSRIRIPITFPLPSPLQNRTFLGHSRTVTGRCSRNSAKRLAPTTKWWSQCTWCTLQQAVLQQRISTAVAATVAAIVSATTAAPCTDWVTVDIVHVLACAVAASLSARNGGTLWRRRPLDSALSVVPTVTVDYRTLQLFVTHTYTHARRTTVTYFRQWETLFTVAASSKHFSVLDWIHLVVGCVAEW